MCKYSGLLAPARGCHTDQNVALNARLLSSYLNIETCNLWRERKCRLSIDQTSAKGFPYQFFSQEVFLSIFLNFNSFSFQDKLLFFARQTEFYFMASLSNFSFSFAGVPSAARCLPHLLHAAPVEESPPASVGFGWRKREGAKCRCRDPRFWR